MPIFLSCLNDKCKWNQDGLPSFFSLHKVCLEIDYLHCSTKLFFPTWQWLLIFTRKKLFSRDFHSSLYPFIDCLCFHRFFWNRKIADNFVNALCSSQCIARCSGNTYNPYSSDLHSFLIFQFVNINFSFRVFAFNLFLGTMFRDLHKLSIFLLCFNY